MSTYLVGGHILSLKTGSIYYCCGGGTVCFFLVCSSSDVIIWTLKVVRLSRRSLMRDFESYKKFEAKYAFFFLLAGAVKTFADVDLFVLADPKKNEKNFNKLL